MIAALIMAAGASRRMGDINKMVLPYNGSTVLVNTINIFAQSQVEKISVVLGYDTGIVHQSIVDSQIDVETDIVVHSDWQEGLASSIQAGVRALSENITGVMVHLGDMPLITQDDINKLISVFKSHHSQKIVAPQYQGIPGHPVVFPKHYFEAILALDPTGNGCRKIMEKNRCDVIAVNCTRNIVRDINTVVDYALLTATQ